MAQTQTVRRGRVASAAADSPGAAFNGTGRVQELEAELAALRANVAQAAQQATRKAERIQIAAGEVEILGQLDIGDMSAAERKALSKIAYDLSKLLKGETIEDGWWASMKRYGATNIKVSHVVVVGVLLGAAVLVWEGIAYKLDLPRFGLFDPSPARRVAR